MGGFRVPGSGLKRACFGLKLPTANCLLISNISNDQASEEESINSFEIRNPMITDFQQLEPTKQYTYADYLTR